MANTEITVFLPIDVPDELKQHLAERLRTLPGVHAVFPASLEEEELLRHAPEADMFVCWRVPPSVIAAATRMRCYMFPGVGVQHLIEPFRQLNIERPIVLTNGHANTYATAQHALALLLALTNRIVPYHKGMAQGRWRSADEDGGESTLLRGRKIGLLGYGHIGSKVHSFLSGFDLEFGVCRRNWDKQTEAMPTEVVRFSSDQHGELLDWADVLIISVPMTSRTKGLIGAAELARLGRRGLVVNVARGTVIDETALYAALKDRTIAGAAIDVWFNYQPEPDDQGRKYPWNLPFHQLDNIVLSPHRAASPIYCPERWEEVVEQVRRFSQGEPLLNVVDLDEGY